MVVVLMIVAYILGSIPNALWIGKVFKGIDVREHGSKNTGSTNAARVLGAKLGILTLILDISKGAIPTLIATMLLDSSISVILVGICAILGHSFSIFMKFKGGKAVATTVGVFIVLVPGAILLAAVIFFLVFGITRYVSLSSMIGAISLPIWIILFYKNIPLTIFGIIIAILIIVRHKSNIQRLLNGTESKFSINKKK
jgi:acyl-phosphate glycerol 3-phosphate acyltransferase